jgi:hypothetical protein
MNGVSNAANVVLAIRSSSIMDGRRRAARRNGDPFAYQRWSEPRAIPPLYDHLNHLTYIISHYHLIDISMHDTSLTNVGPILYEILK